MSVWQAAKKLRPQRSSSISLWAGGARTLLLTLKQVPCSPSRPPHQGPTSNLFSWPFRDARNTKHPTTRLKNSCPWVKLEAVFMYTALWLQAGAARPSFSQRFCTSLGLPATAASGLETCFLAGLKLAMLAYNLTWLFYSASVLQAASSQRRLTHHGSRVLEARNAALGLGEGANGRLDV